MKGSQLVGVAQADHYPLPSTYTGKHRGEQLIEFFGCLPMISGRLLDSAIPNQCLSLTSWQRTFLSKLEPEVRTGIISMARKNGKTSFMAALCLAALCTRPIAAPLVDESGEVVLISSNLKQAEIVWTMILTMLLRMPNQLHGHGGNLIVRQHSKTITNPDSNTMLHVLPQAAGTLLGRSPSLAVLDETAAWAQTNTRGKGVFEAMATAMAARKTPLLLMASTQAADDEHWFSQELDYALKVESGELDDPTIASAIYYSTGKEPIDTAIRKANPSVADGLLTMSELKSEYQKAKALPQRMGSYKNLRLNQRVSTDPEAEMFEREQWIRGKQEYTWEDIRDEPLLLGLDISSSVALTALVAFSRQSNRTYTWAWCARKHIETTTWLGVVYQYGTLHTTQIEKTLVPVIHASLVFA